MLTWYLHSIINLVLQGQKVLLCTQLFFKSNSSVIKIKAKSGYAALHRKPSLKLILFFFSLLSRAIAYVIIKKFRYCNRTLYPQTISAPGHFGPLSCLAQKHLGPVLKKRKSKEASALIHLEYTALPFSIPWEREEEEGNYVFPY